MIFRWSDFVPRSISFTRVALKTKAWHYLMAYVNIVTYVEYSTWKHEGIWSYGNKPLLWRYRLFPYLKVSSKSKLPVPARDTSIDKVLIYKFTENYFWRASFRALRLSCLLSGAFCRVFSHIFAFSVCNGPWIVPFGDAFWQTNILQSRICHRSI